MPIQLYIKDSGAPVGTINQDQLQALVDALEEEHPGDQDYWIDADILDYLADEGVDAPLLELLRPHVPEGDGVEIVWKHA